MAQVGVMGVIDSEDPRPWDFHMKEIEMNQENFEVAPMDNSHELIVDGAPAGWTAVDDDLWCTDGEIKMGPGVHMPLRSTLIRLRSGQLWLHSPITFEASALAGVHALGRVETLVAPSGFHHLYMADARTHFADARVWSSAAVRAKQPTLEVDGWLGEESPGWATEIEPLLIDGMPKIQEWVFFHHGTRTLIVTDLVFNLLETKGLLTALCLKLFGTHGRFAQSRLFKSFIKDRAAYDRSVEALLQLPTERVVMAHGQVLDGNGVHERLTRALLG